MDVAAAGQTIHRTAGTGYIGEHLPIGPLQVEVVPDFDSNLLSVAQVTNQGVDVKFTNTSVILTDRATDQELYTGPRVGDSYKLRIQLPNRVRKGGRAHFGHRRKDPALKHLTNKQLIMLWHRRLPHPSASRLHRSITKQHIKGTGIDINTPLKVFEEVIQGKCKACELGKARLPAHHRTEPPNNKHSSAPGERLHFDTKTINKRSWGNNIMTGILVDDFTRELSSHPMRAKSETPEVLATHQLEHIQPNQFSTKVIRMDRAGEQTGESMKKFCAKFRIKPNFNSPGDSRGNGVAERHIEIVEAAANTYRCQSALPVSSWAETYATACVGLNFLCNAANPDMQSAMQMLRNGESQDVSFMRIPGCKCIVFTHPKNRRPQEDRGVEGILVGYNLPQRCYRVKVPGTTRLMESKFVTFFESLDDLGEISTDSECSEVTTSNTSFINNHNAPEPLDDSVTEPSSNNVEVHVNTSTTAATSTSEPVNVTPQSVSKSSNEHIIIPSDLAPFLDPALSVHGVVDPNLTSRSQPVAVVTQSQPSQVPIQEAAVSVPTKSRRRGVRFQNDSLQTLQR